MLQILNCAGKSRLSRAPGFTSGTFLKAAKECIIAGELESLASDSLFPSFKTAKL